MLSTGWLKKLNNLIRGEMKAQGVTQEKLGYYIGLSRSEFGLKLSGKVAWRLSEVMGICEYLKIGAEVKEILFGEEK